MSSQREFLGGLFSQWRERNSQCINKVNDIEVWHAIFHFSRLA